MESAAHFLLLSSALPQLSPCLRSRWSHPPGSNRRPADYETENRPISCSVSIAIRRFCSPLDVLLGGFWMGNWMGKGAHKSQIGLEGDVSVAPRPDGGQGVFTIAITERSRHSGPHQEGAGVFAGGVGTAIAGGRG
jgi:hypothetical protein